MLSIQSWENAYLELEAREKIYDGRVMEWCWYKASEFEKAVLSHLKDYKYAKEFALSIAYRAYNDESCEFCNDYHFDLSDIVCYLHMNVKGGRYWQDVQDYYDKEREE